MKLDDNNIQRITDAYVSGKYGFKNFSEEENDTARRDRILAAAEVACRLYGSTDREESQDAKNERQERQVEQWAKNVGAWHDDAISFCKTFGNETIGGQESRVFVHYKNGSVVKAKNTTQYRDLQEFLDGIILHNTMFPETAYRVLGFGDDGKGFVAILEQTFIHGVPPEQEQIDDFILSSIPETEKHEMNIGEGRYKTSRILLHDLTPKNAIITPGCNIAVIDAIIRQNVVS